MENLRKHIIHLIREGQLPPFLHPEFLDLICKNGTWHVLTEDVKNPNVLWFYYLKKKVVPYITMPALAKYMGPFILDSSTEKHVLDTMISKLPKTTYTYQQWNPETSFKHANAVQKGQSFIWDVSISADQLLKNMNANYRRSISKYQKAIAFDNTIPSSQSIELLKKSISDIEMTGLSEQALLHVFDWIRASDMGAVLGLKYQEQYIATAVILYHKQSAYYLLAGNQRVQGNIYPGVQMAWYTAQFIQELQIPNLDFLGSNIESIATIWTKLGATKVNYPIYEHKTTTYNTLQKIKRIFNR